MQQHVAPGDAVTICMAKLLFCNIVGACVHVRACACMCVHVRACACMCVHVRACACMCVHVRACACMCVHVRACVSYVVGGDMNERILSAEAKHAISNEGEKSNIIE